MADARDESDEKPADEAAGTTPKPRKLLLTKRVLRQFSVRTGLQTGLNDYGEDPGDPNGGNEPTNSGSVANYRTTTYYG